MLPSRGHQAQDDGGRNASITTNTMEQPQEQEGSDDVFEFPEKETQTGYYEIMVLITGDVNDEDAQKVFGQVKQEITSLGGTIASENALGRQALGYTVDGAKSGTYAVAEFDMDKPQVRELNEKLRIHKGINRFLIVKKHKKTEAELAEEKKDEEERKHKRQQYLQKKMKEDEEKQKAEEKASAPEPAKKEEVPFVTTSREEQKKDEKKKSIEDLDKEIDKLLSEDLDV